MSKWTIIRTGQYRDNIDEIEVYGPFTEKEAMDFQDALEKKSIHDGTWAMSRMVEMKNQLPS